MNFGIGTNDNHVSVRSGVFGGYNQSIESQQYQNNTASGQGSKLASPVQSLSQSKRNVKTMQSFGNHINVNMLAS